jgi:hypothetical protein
MYTLYTLAFDIDVKELLDKKKASVEPQSDYNFLFRVNSGKELLNTIIGTHMYRYDNDDLEDEEQVELVGDFFQELNDLGDLWEDLEPRDRIKAEFELNNSIKELEDRGFWIFGGKNKEYRKFPFQDKDEEKIITFICATIYVVKSTNPRIKKFSVSKESIYVKNGGQG